MINMMMGNDMLNTMSTIPSSTQPLNQSQTIIPVSLLTNTSGSAIPSSNNSNGMYLTQQQQQQQPQTQLSQPPNSFKNSLQQQQQNLSNNNQSSLNVHNLSSQSQSLGQSLSTT
jgi:hypothetical protein